MIIAIDFDGTIVTHEYPVIGQLMQFRDGVTSFKVMKKLQDKGHKLILYTMRSGKELEQAVEYCRENGIEFWGVNKNPEQKLWTSSPKIYANIYIDDAALGSYTVTKKGVSRMYINWWMVQKNLIHMGIL